MIRLSVIIITLNEAGLIEQCLRSLPDHDELIVVDSGSTDGTQAICKRFGAKLLQTDWPGFGPQKNRALDLAQGHWVLSVDADEQFDASLRAEISRVTGLDNHEGADSDKATGDIREDMGQVQAHAIVNAYRFRRRSSFAGQYMRFGDWRRDKVLRLFRRDCGRFSELAVHESVQVRGPVGELSGLMLHQSIQDWADAMSKARLYAELSVARMQSRGSVGPMHGVLHAIWTFTRGFVFRLGCLDGYNGLRLALANAWGTYLRYSLAAEAISTQSTLEK